MNKNELSYFKRWLITHVIVSATLFLCGGVSFSLCLLQHPAPVSCVGWVIVLFVLAVCGFGLCDGYGKIVNDSCARGTLHQTIARQNHQIQTLKASLKHVLRR